MTLKLHAPGTRKNNPFYLVTGYHTGKYVEKSLKTRDPDEARLRMMELEIALVRGAKDAPSFTFREAALLYLDTHTHLNKAQRGWVGALEVELGERQAASITTADLVRVAKKLRPHAQPQTHNRQVLVTGAAILHHAAEENRIPWVRIKKLKEKRPEPKAVSRETAKVIVNSTTGMRRVFLLFLFKHGWRLNEVLALQWAHIDVGGRTVRRRISKIDEWTTLPIAGEALAALLAEVPAERRVGRVFPWANKSNVYRWLRPYCKGLGVTFTPHMARHSFATWAANDGYNQTDIMAAGGWQDSKSVERYTKVSPDRVRSVLDRGNKG